MGYCRRGTGGLPLGARWGILGLAPGATHQTRHRCVEPRPRNPTSPPPGPQSLVGRQRTSRPPVDLTYVCTAMWRRAGAVGDKADSGRSSDAPGWSESGWTLWVESPTLMRSCPARPRKSTFAGDGPLRRVCVRARGQWSRTAGVCGRCGARVGPGRAYGGPDRARECHGDAGESGGDVLLSMGVTFPALRTLPKSGKQRVRGHVTGPTPVVTPPPCPKVGRRWRPQPHACGGWASLGDLSGRPWKGDGGFGGGGSWG